MAQPSPAEDRFPPEAAPLDHQGGSNKSLAGEGLLKIGDVARQTDMTLRTLRYYEELGLIQPDNRTKGNFRLYAPSIIRRLTFINSLKKLDFSLEEIRALLGSCDEWEQDADIVVKTRQALKVKREKIMEKLIELEQMKQEVERTLTILDECMLCQAEQHHSCDPGCHNRSAHIS